jgi:hypothetical protein
MPSPTLSANSGVPTLTRGSPDRRALSRAVGSRWFQPLSKMKGSLNLKPAVTLNAYGIDVRTKIYNSQKPLQQRSGGPS